MGGRLEEGAAKGGGEEGWGLGGVRGGVKGSKAGERRVTAALVMTAAPR